MTITVAGEPISADKDPGHLVLLALNPAGYRSLRRLSSLIQASPERAQRAACGLNWAALAEHREGLICLSGRRRFPEAVSTVGEIAARCGPALPDGRPIWPALKLPANQTPAERLADLAQEGLAARHGPEVAPEIRPRLQHELAAINRHDYAPLFFSI